MAVDRGPSRVAAWSLALTIFAVALAIGTLKLVVIASCENGNFCVEVLQADDFLRPILTSLLGGALFVLGLVLVGTLTDYKESERFPAEFVGALTSIYDVGRALREGGIPLTKDPVSGAFNVEGLRSDLVEVCTTLDQDLHTPGVTDHCLKLLPKIHGSIVEMERSGLPTAHATRLLNELATVRRGVLRIYHMQAMTNIL